MLKIWSMKQQQQKNEAASGQTKKKKVTAAQLRVQKGKSHTSSTALGGDGKQHKRTPLTPKTNRSLRTLPPRHHENHLP
jgi:ubiquitin-conjugating enzyme E2 M